jgi:hypothetical protein
MPQNFFLVFLFLDGRLLTYSLLVKREPVILLPKLDSIYSALLDVSILFIHC